MDPERVKTNATVFDPLQGRESNRSIRGRRPDESGLAHGYSFISFQDENNEMELIQHSRTPSLIRKNLNNVSLP